MPRSGGPKSSYITLTLWLKFAFLASSHRHLISNLLMRHTNNSSFIEHEITIIILTFHPHLFHHLLLRGHPGRAIYILLFRETWKLISYSFQFSPFTKEVFFRDPTSSFLAWGSWYIVKWLLEDEGEWLQKRLWLMKVH